MERMDRPGASSTARANLASGRAVTLVELLADVPNDAPMLVESPKKESSAVTKPTRSSPGALIALIALIALSLGHRPASADPQDAGVGASLEATLFFKVLTYDRNLKKRSGSKLVVGVVYSEASEASKKVRDEMVTAFQTVGKKVTVQGMAPRVVAVAFDEAKLTSSLRDAGVTAIYVAPGLEASLATIVIASKDRKAPTLTRKQKQVEAGLAIGVVAKNGKPKIVVNVTAAKALEMDLDPKIIGIASVVK